MKVIVVGLGIQGRKRKEVAGSDVVATIDPVMAGADAQRHRRLRGPGRQARLLRQHVHVPADGGAADGSHRVPTPRTEG